MKDELMFCYVELLYCSGADAIVTRMAHRIIEAMLNKILIVTPGRPNHEMMRLYLSQFNLRHPSTLLNTGVIEPRDYDTILSHLDPSATPAMLILL